MNKIKKKIIIGFSIGDYNGIGPEILLKSFHKSDLFKQCVPVIFCDEEILNFYSNKLNLKISVEDIKDIDEVNESNSFYCFKVDPENIKINPGKIDKIAGSYSIKSLDNCSNALMKKSIDGMVTLPICKINSQNTRFPFPGHTEYFIKKFEVNNNIMIMHSNLMNIGFITGHIPLNSILSKLSEDYIEKKMIIYLNSLIKDFKIKHPKIAVLGLNPHAGEEGLIGNDEIKTINPILKKLNRNQEIFHGPFSSDSFFGLQKFKNFDGIISWYHDQGLVGFKSFSFDLGVNFTGGLPYVRTSPDHGTAFNIAGKGVANERSLVESIKLNIKIINNRKFR